MKKIIIYILFSLVLFSCVEEKQLEQSKNILTFRLEIPQVEAITRATKPGIGNENTINSLKLYFFDGETMVYDAWVPSLSIKIGEELFLPIPENKINFFKGNISYTVCAIANLDESLSGKTFSQFKEYVVTKGIGSEDFGDFVMVALVSSKQLDISENNDVGTFKMQRLAVKTRVALTSVSVAGYNVSIADNFYPNISLKNITDRSVLIPKSPVTLPMGMQFSNSSEKDISIGANNFVTFYTYPNNWKGKEENETYFYLTLPLLGEGKTKTRNYYYKISLNGNKEMQIFSNHLYEVNILVNKLGSTNPDDPLIIKANIDVKDWIVDEDAYGMSSEGHEIKKAHYLAVSETALEMKNIREYTINYSTSDPIKIDNIKASFTYVDNTTGKEVNKKVYQEESQFPYVSLIDGNKIKITSDIPVNYIIKEITFTVRHQEASTGISPINISIKQYPSLFITHTEGIKSSLRPNGILAQDLNNKAIYRITTLVQDLKSFGADFNNFVIGFPPTHSMSFYRQEGWGRYYEKFSDSYVTDYFTPGVDNMISPNFELASQLGASLPQPYVFLENNYWMVIYYRLGIWGGLNLYEDAVDDSFRPYGAVFNCAKYTETRIENGRSVTLDNWRLPTRAEIKLIDAMQHDSNGVVKRIMTGKYYWSNLSGEAIELSQGKGNVSKTNAYVRCVRDVKE